MKRASLSASLALASVMAAAFPASAASGMGWAPILTAPSALGGPVTDSALRDRVVVVDVFTFECSNCARVVHELRKLRLHYAPRDLAIVGVHAPEVPSYQSRRSYVAHNAIANGFAWPVVLDNHFTLWRHYNVEAWPTQLVFDRRGRLRARVVGEGNDKRLADLVERFSSER